MPRIALSALPLPWVLAATLCSTPVLFAMERGNWDLLVLAPLALAAFALKEPTWQRDCLAGSCLALAAWIKLYPGLEIAQLSFMMLDRPAERPYGSPDLGSHYQGQRAATESRYEGSRKA